MTEEDWFFYHARMEFRKSPGYSPTREFAEYRNKEWWLASEDERHEARLKRWGPPSAPPEPQEPSRILQVEPTLFFVDENLRPQRWNPNASRTHRTAPRSR